MNKLPKRVKIALDGTSLQDEDNGYCGKVDCFPAMTTSLVTRYNAHEELVEELRRVTLSLTLANSGTPSGPEVVESAKSLLGRVGVPA